MKELDYERPNGRVIQYTWFSDQLSFVLRIMAVGGEERE
jgi:hypothetical protein